MHYHRIKHATFLKRPNRFIAHVMVDGQEEIVHVKNTGRCLELLQPKAAVILEQAENPHRKTKYSLIGVYKKDTLINIDSQAPNTVVGEGIVQNKIKELPKVSVLKKEVTYGHSRFDWYFETLRTKGFIEVKGVTLENQGLALFPDAPTARGTKHIYEMMDAVKNGYQGLIIFLIQMQGVSAFTPNLPMDAKFSAALVRARDEGVNILAYDALVTPDEITIGGKINVLFPDSLNI
ncbi:DNA/RNA nuclease SfsA [Candidatus Formimonas warabiya]|uniref:Sugar fermentation stimulation protein homolog n=1 Tax=Formimonas warabiya TaxID=1761012 RepID=A0A3G1KRS7_FORW1|nr:DNA/RNA nuclease SfsA [Candidatus Formimonas warabiya]ATW25146.1 sugar fermentation stimulation protein SfsA [Candidatus Formimonas warabiya]